MLADNLFLGNYLNPQVKGVVLHDEIHIVEPTTYMILLNQVESKNITFVPIPLTEDWLRRANFEQLTSTDDGSKLNTWSYKGNFSLILHFNNGLLSTNFWQGNEKKYVHELQNLFFILTGTPLIFKNF